MSTNSKLEINRARFQKLNQLLEQFLPLTRWGFQESYSHILAEYRLYVIYDSEWCRVRFSLGGGDQYFGDELSISYGKLHAPNDKNYMIFKGEDCWCWHSVLNALDFLDGTTPQQAVDRLQANGQWPWVAEHFRQSELAQNLKYNHPEWLIRMHSAIWSHYGKRLFELFDLRRPDLWEQYTRFIREYYRIKGIPAPIPGYSAPPYDKIC